MKIGLLGCGAYGLALSSIMHDNYCEITMWTRLQEEADELTKTRCNKEKLPGYKIPEDIKITSNIKECVTNKDLIVIAIPAAGIDSLAQKMIPYIKRDDHILIATKGIEQGTGLFIHEIILKYLKTRNVAAISGPSFAVDLITKMPAGLSVAGKRKETIARAKLALGNSYIKRLPPVKIYKTFISWINIILSIFDFPF